MWLLYYSKCFHIYSLIWALLPYWDGHGRYSHPCFKEERLAGHAVSCVDGRLVSGIPGQHHFPSTHCAPSGFPACMSQAHPLFYVEPLTSLLALYLNKFPTECTYPHVQRPAHIRIQIHTCAQIHTYTHTHRGVREWAFKMHLKQPAPHKKQLRDNALWIHSYFCTVQAFGAEY